MAKVAWIFGGACIFINCCTIAYYSKRSLAPELVPELEASTSDVAATVRGDDFGLRLEYYRSRIFSMNHDNVSEEKQDKCTMIMLTYRRIKSLPKVITSYCNITTLDKLLVIWNDIENTVPQSILDISKKCPVKLLFITPKENKMSNRFWPRPEIETECVCIMDDDLVFSATDMESGFRVWQKFKHLLVGYYDRTRGYTLLKDNTYRYSAGGVRKEQLSPYHKPGYSIILPAVFLHRAYLEMLFDHVMISNELVEYIDEIMNCDDILMNVMVTKFMNDCGWPQSGGLQLKHEKWIKSYEGMNRGPNMHRGLAARPNHYTTRTKCLNKFAEFFGYLPLTPQRMTLTNHLS